MTVTRSFVSPWCHSCHHDHFITRHHAPPAPAPQPGDPSCPEWPYQPLGLWVSSPGPDVSAPWPHPGRGHPVLRAPLWRAEVSQQPGVCQQARGHCEASHHRGRGRRCQLCPEKRPPGLCKYLIFRGNIFIIPDFQFSVRSGGHSYTCTNIRDGGLHIDLRRLAIILQYLHLTKTNSIICN